MTYQATAINVMIASPSDVAHERRLVKEVIEEWNTIHAQHRGQVLMGMSWDTHSSPELGERPQGIINKQVLKDSDLLIAVFWTRLGSPTGLAVSGTIEEIEEHVKLGRPAMLYFSAAPVRLDSVDGDQYSALKEFKEDFRKRGLVEEYESLSEFKDKIGRQLAQTIIRKFPTQVQSLGPSQNIKILTHADLPRFPSLSSDAEELLIEASKDKSGIIVCLATMGGYVVQAGGRNFITTDDNRETARWKSVVEELKSKNLIKDQGFKNEVFAITDLGYRTADNLNAQRSS